ncbi:murein hydrolase regulator LrgA [Brevibacillus fluminis]|uniref:Murein hydrolase regulator LrgA n=1 Tax=Brevibacillus fluminis TaxID=511487 RepID=A0A3M8DW60_9BACL|nr:CidA/LrgA family protein [Brevibacillus fluminis]RNB92410.1 murein hydrolase regulator LrgA [Brevibacillus fluminis]
MKKWLHAFPQICLILLFSLIGKAFVAYTHIGIPSSLIGLALLFFSLQLGVVRLNWVEAGAAILFADMLLFFVPAVVGIMKFPWLIGVKGLFVLLIVMCGTGLAMMVTGVVSDRLLRVRIRSGEVKTHAAAKNM